MGGTDMSQIMTVGAASMMEAGAVAQLVKQAGLCQPGEVIEVTSFAPFALSLPEVGVLCQPHSVASFTLRDPQALQRALHSAIQIAELNRTERLLILRGKSAAASEPGSKPEPTVEQKPDFIPEPESAPEPEPTVETEAVKAAPKTKARTKAK